MKEVSCQDSVRKKRINKLHSPSMLSCAVELIAALRIEQLKAEHGTKNRMLD